MTAEMNDWPESLRRNAVVCELARAIFEARGRFHNVAFDMTEEAPHVRERYVTLAHELLKKLEPAKPADALFNLAVSLTRAHYATGLRRDDKIIGTITPDGD